MEGREEEEVGRAVGGGGPEQALVRHTYPVPCTYIGYIVCSNDFKELFVIFSKTLPSYRWRFWRCEFGRTLKIFFLIINNCTIVHKCPFLLLAFHDGSCMYEKYNPHCAIETNVGK